MYKQKEVKKTQKKVLHETSQKEGENV